MIIEDNELEVLQRLESPENLVNKLEIRKKYEGRGKNQGDIDIPDLIKEVAIEAGYMGGTNEDIANALGISDGTVSMAKRGLVGKRLDTALMNKVKEVREGKKQELDDKKDTAHEKALDSLLESFDIVKEEMAVQEIELVDGTKVKPPRNLKRLKQATAIAKDLAAISGTLTGRDENINPNKTLIIEVPAQKHIDNYIEVTVNNSSL